MKNSNENFNSSKKKIKSIIFLTIFIILAVILLIQLNSLRELFGFEPSLNFDVSKMFIILLIIISLLSFIVILFYVMILSYRKIPLITELVEVDKILQKKKFIPRYRITYILKVIGLPRKFLIDVEQKDSSIQELFCLKNWDIITSLAQIKDEISFWVVKNSNKIQLYFTISSWSWFKREKAESIAKKSTLSLKAAFINKYPSIKFENIKLDDSKNLFQVINKCKFGLKVKGIPALKTNQVQIDRLINTFNSLNENCYYVVAISGIKRGFEKKQNLKLFLKNDTGNEFEEDFIDAKKTGQSKIGIYSFSESENGMHVIFAALLSIWSGTQTFEIEKLGINKKYSNNLININPIKYNRLSNKSISALIHLPEKPFFTEDTDQPIFEIPIQNIQNSKLEIKIGNIVQNDKILDEFTIPLENFLFNVEIVGMIGRGKTYLVASILEQLLKINLGCLIFDLKGEYSKFFVTDSNVIVYTIGAPAPLGINLFQINSTNEAQNVLALISEMLSISGSPFSPTMLSIFESALQKIVKRNDKNLEIFMKCLYESSEEYANNMKTSYSRDSIDAILNRLNYIFGGVNFEIFSALYNTLDFSHLDNGKKIIIDFSEFLRRGSNIASLFLVCNLILHLLSKHASEKGITNDLRYLVILEEAMYLIPKRFNLESTASLGYSEQNFIMGRSLGIGTISIYQLWDSVSSVVHANSLTKILFRAEEIDKIKSSIVLTVEQSNYLAHLPERNFILKSKSLSGPALLKTITFNKSLTPLKEYLKIAEEKFHRNGFSYLKITKNLIDLKKEIFEKEIGNSAKSILNENTGKIGQQYSEEPTLTRNQINDDFWYQCFNFCTIRMNYKDKKSDWIKKNVCTKVIKIANEISSQLISRNDLTPLYEIFNKSTNHFIQKIFDYYLQNEERYNPKLLTFCTINLILNKLKNKFKLNDEWKDKLLIKIKQTLNDESIMDSSVYKN